MKARYAEDWRFQIEVIRVGEEKRPEVFGDIHQEQGRDESLHRLSSRQPHFA